MTPPLAKPAGGAALALALIVLLLAPGSAGAGFVDPYRDAPATVWAVGDGADGSVDSIAVAQMIERAAPDRFLYLGDVYDTGTTADFEDNYAPVYSRFDPIAAPTPGNHEWDNREDGYYPYWSAATGLAVPDWYAFRVSGWHLLSLNSEAPMEPGSEQSSWLRQQLRQSRSVGNCRLAFWHHPRYSAGANGDQEQTEPLWQALDHKARIVVNGHDHDMQRHRPRRGIVQFVAGTGGHALSGVDEDDPEVAFALGDTLGALRLVLTPGKARYAFVSVDGETLDSGTVRCRRGQR